MRHLRRDAHGGGDVAARVCPARLRVAEAEYAEHESMDFDWHHQRRSRGQLAMQLGDPPVTPAGHGGIQLNAGSEQRLAGAHDMGDRAVAVVVCDAICTNQRADEALSIVGPVRAADAADRAARHEVRQTEVCERGHHVTHVMFNRATSVRDRRRLRGMRLRSERGQGHTSRVRLRSIAINGVGFS